MNWKTLCEATHLQNLPYKIELNTRGQIIMSPAKLVHGRFQSRIAHLLEKFAPHGEAVTECAIQTAESTKVADVGWFSQARWAQVKEGFDAVIAPEICVEIISQSNTKEELQRKKSLYFEAGALEFWLCAETGDMEFWTKDEALPSSKLIPAFPLQVKISR